MTGAIVYCAGHAFAGQILLRVDNSVDFVRALNARELPNFLWEALYRLKIAWRRSVLRARSG